MILRSTTKMPEIWKAASTDKTRHVLNGVYYEITDGPEGKQGRLIATDGRKLVYVPCQYEDGDVPGIIPNDAMKEAYKQGKKLGIVSIKTFLPEGYTVGKCKLQNAAEYSMIDGQFPKYEQVIPNFEGKKTIKVCINPDFLIEISEAIGKGNAAGTTLELSLNSDGEFDLGPIVVSCGTGDKTKAIVMPMRM